MTYYPMAWRKHGLNWRQVSYMTSVRADNDNNETRCLVVLRHYDWLYSLLSVQSIICTVH